MIDKENRVFVATTFALFILGFCILFAGKVFEARINAIINAKTRNVSTVNINWEELYPFEKVVDEITTEDHKTGFRDNLAQLVQKIQKLGTVGSDWSKLFYGYSNVARIGYIIKSRLTDPSIGNTYVKLKNGYWVTVTQKITVEKAKKEIAPYAALNKYLNERGIGYLYFATPVKDCAIDNQYPDGIDSWANDNIDNYLQALGDYGIEYIDLREELHKAGLDHYSMFYKTDHHWTVECGLWAASVIVKNVSQKLGVAMADPSEKRYKNVTYPDAEFGSMGNGVTHFVEKSEDFVIPYPVFKTQYRLEIPNKGIDAIGSFDEIFVDQAGLEELAKNGGGAAYGKILSGEPPYQKITNINNPTAPKVLMIRDSFATVVAPYLALSCSELVMLDARPGNGNFTGSIINCIDQFNPDIVLGLHMSPQPIRLNKGQ